MPAFEPHPAAPDAPDRASLRICNTIAVLPFVNVGGTADTQAFGEGLAEELICGLGQVPGFRVVARSSSFAFQGTAVDVREAGRRLNAEAVLEGTVRCWRGQVRVTAQLVDVATGLHLWSERFDRRLDHLFALQDEMARRIVGTLGGRLTRGVSAPAEPESYRLYLKGRLHWARVSSHVIPRSLR